MRDVVKISGSCFIISVATNVRQIRIFRRVCEIQFREILTGRKHIGAINRGKKRVREEKKKHSDNIFERNRITVLSVPLHEIFDYSANHDRTVS